MLVRRAERGQPPRHGKQHDDATAVLMTGQDIPAAGKLRWPVNWRSLVGL